MERTGEQVAWDDCLDKCGKPKRRKKKLQRNTSQSTLEMGSLAAFSFLSNQNEGNSGSLGLKPFSLWLVLLGEKKGMTT